VKPSDHYRTGECGFCHGSGVIHLMVPTDHDEPCPACEGTGTFPLPEHIQRAVDAALDLQVHRRQVQRRATTLFALGVLITALGVSDFLSVIIGDPGLTGVLSAALVTIGVLTLLVTWLGKAPAAGSVGGPGPGA
jgi:hypothetical protein